MSAIRHVDGRSQARKAHSSPYARPQNSGWSLSKLLEPIRRRVFGKPIQHEDSDDNVRGLQIQKSDSIIEAGLTGESTYGSLPDNTSEASAPPRSPSKSESPKRRPPAEGDSIHATLENVLDFLTDATGTALKREEAHTLVALIHKGMPGERTVSDSLVEGVGRRLGAIEVEGMISLIRKQMPQRSEPFRFQSAPPSRGTSPFTASTTPTPKKSLTRNPNGTYRWQGAGSAKQVSRRNRYSSPAFGTPGLTQGKTAPKDSTNLGDGKRRKLDEEKPSFFASPPSTTSESSTSQQRLPFPISSSPQNARPATNGAPPPPRITIQPAAPTTPSRLRSPALAKPTTPSHPSPLRQAWTGSPNTSSEDLSQPDRSHLNATPPKPSQAASFMSELIKEVTPPKKPDLSNPYQTANPLAKVGPPRRSMRRTRATARPSTADAQKADSATENAKGKKEKEQAVKDYPPEAIVEATLPKGSKRSRPPARLEKSTSSETPRSPSPINERNPQRHDAYTVEEVDDDERSDKKMKGINGVATTTQYSKESDIVVEEVDTVSNPMEAAGPSPPVFGNAASTTTGVGSRPLFGGFKPTTAPSKPSRLRFSYQPEASAPSSPTSQEDQTSASGSMDLDAPPPPTVFSSFSSLPSPPKLPTPPVASTAAEAKLPVLDPKAQALCVDVTNLPSFTFVVSTSKSSLDTYVAARAEAKSKPVSALPKFDFSRETLTAGPSKPTVASAPAAKGFDWAAAGMKAPAVSASEWKCTSCDLSNPDSAKEKCAVCDAPRPGTTAKAEKEAPKAGFNWEAAGMKAPTSSGSKWRCSSCMLENLDTATKCTICDEPKPGAAQDPAAPKGFDWTAAGLKPATPPASTWSCSLCGCSSPTSAEKCVVCDTPR